MGKCKMKLQGGSRGRGRGRKRKCEDSDGSTNEDVTPMKLKIRIGGHRLMKKKAPLIEENEDEMMSEGAHCSIEEEVVNEEFVIDQLEEEHFEPDAGYFEEIVNNQEQYNDDDDEGDGDDDEDDDDDGGEKDEENEDNNSKRVHRKKDTEWGDKLQNYKDDEEDDDEDNEKNEHGDDLSDDEKKWLDALESGQLNENGEVKDSERSNIALTARQRALLYGEKIEELLELSSIQPAEMTEEQLMKRKKKALRRKQLEVEKTERDKKETLDRLLKKQDSRLKTCKNLPLKDNLDHAPCYRYSNTSEGIRISVPAGFEFPMEKRVFIEARPPIKCGVEGCTNDKKYSCSRTNIPLCSLECYKKNMLESPYTAPIHLATI